jgi:hypothetical protein
MKLRFISLALVFLAAASAANAQSSNGAAQSDNDGQTTAATQPASVGQPASTPRSWWEPMGGFDFDTNSTGYGWVGPQYQYKLNDNVGIVGRAGLNYLYYEFEDVGGRTRVSGPGVNAAVGVRVGGSNWFQVTAGPSWVQRNHTLKVTDGSDIDQGGEWHSGIQYGGDVFFNPTRRSNVMGQAMYSTSDNFHWLRGMGKQQVTNYGWTNTFTHYVGGELVGMGNEDFDTVQIGGLFEFLHVKSSASIALRSGWKRQTTPLGAPQSGPYFGIGYWQSLR